MIPERMIEMARISGRVRADFAPLFAGRSSRDRNYELYSSVNSVFCALVEDRPPVRVGAGKTIDDQAIRLWGELVGYLSRVVSEWGDPEIRSMVIRGMRAHVEYMDECGQFGSFWGI